MLRWFRRRDPDAELAEEFETHLALEEERQRANGLSPDAAAELARRKFGSPLLYREQVSELRGMIWLERLRLDVTSALRTLAHRPLATGASIVALAIGMGGPTVILMLIANISTAVFPQIKQPDDLVMLWETPPNQPDIRQPASEATWRVWRSHPELFATLSVAQPPVPLTLTLGEVPEHIIVQPLAASLLPMLGVAPETGRGFVASDEAAGAPPVVLVSHSFWQARLGGATSAVGSTLSLDGQARTIIGIMPRAFWVTNRGSAFWLTSRDVDLWVPLPEASTPESRYIVIGRLKPGDRRDALSARLQGLSPQVGAANSPREAGWNVNVAGFGPRSMLDDAYQQPGILMLIVATALALFVACANVAMLMVARGSARQKETAIRSALGAGRSRIVRQFLTESTLVAVGGGALALFFAYAALQLIVAQATPQLPAGMSGQMDWRVVGAVTALSALVGVLAGLAPALADSRINLVSALKETGFFSSGPRRSRLRRTLIVAEVALTVTLIACVSLLIRGALDLEQTNPGFDPAHLLRVRIDAVQHLGRTSSRAPDFRATLEHIRGVHGVEGAAAVAVAPPFLGNPRPVRLAMTSDRDSEQLARVLVNDVSAGYFSTVGLRILQGETFAANVGDDVAVVSHAFAARHWPGQAPLGQTFTVEKDSAPRRVIGVVSDQLLEGGRRLPAAVAYIPFTERPGGRSPRHSLTIVVRTAPGVEEVVAGLRRAIAEADPLQPVDVSTVESILRVAALEVRVGAYLAGPLMLLALLLTISGIYGMLAQSVAQRTHELAVRVTLGARRSDLLRLVSRDALILAGAGAVIGVAFAWSVDQALTAFLLGVPGEEPIALAASALLIIAVTLLVCVAPYRRALRIDPGKTLRYE
jgi:putative ABC transport system permease protein